MTTSDWLPAQWLDREEAPSVSVSPSVVPDSLRPHGLQPTSFLCPWDFPGKDTGVGGLPFPSPGGSSSKALPKAKLVPQKGHSHFDGLLPIWSTSVLNPSEIIKSEKYAQKIDEMHWKLQCLLQVLVNRMGPILYDNTRPQVAQPTRQKLNKLGYEILPHPLYSPDLSPTNYHFFKHLDNFLEGKHFHNQQEAENAFQEFPESWSIDFYATGINLFLIGKNALIVMPPILISKDVFKPSYNDLKFRVHTCNYFCTNLMIIW